MDKDYLEYIGKMRKKRRGEIFYEAGTIMFEGLKFVKNPKRLGQVGLGYRRSSFEKPIHCKVLGSFTCDAGGGYIVRRIDNQKIIQVQSFKEEGK